MNLGNIAIVPIDSLGHDFWAKAKLGCGNDPSAKKVDNLWVLWRNCFTQGLKFKDLKKIQPVAK